MDVVEIGNTLEEYRRKCADHLARTVKIQSIWEDAIKYGVKPDYDAHTANGTWINIAEFSNESVEGNFPLDVEATQRRFAVVVQWAKDRGYGIEKKYDENEFRIHVKIDDDTSFRFFSTRQVVCKKVVKGTKVIPERVEEEVEWVCDKVAFLKVEV